MRTLVIGALVVVGLLALAYATRRPVLRALARPLVALDEVGACDAIVLLNGSISTRPYRAAELYRAHSAPVLLARLADTEEVRLGLLPNINDTTGRLLIRLGVPEVDVRVLDSDRWVAGTRAEAVMLCDHIRTHGYRRVAIVTDAFHTRRARWTFRRVIGDPGVEFVATATAFSLGAVERWWQSEYGLVQLITEYVKFAYYRCIEGSKQLRPPAMPTELPPEEPVRKLVSGCSHR